ncbi:unnamed protein product [Rotaria sordida]|uniref:Uncharacterized protein n=1 Tax=Rotaria sordida TaxID=392033 RepID=A0A814KQZ1_9BILA|nr:unnamed protein product [Rotaria sordida]CAF1223549.1 unnamed protein product [Rotaria sordida]
MSYATNLLTAYPPSYDLSTLMSDDLVQRSSFGTFYESSSIPYTSGNRLPSDDFTHNQLDLGPTTYRSSIYSQFPSANYRTPSITDWRQNVRSSQNPYTSFNNIKEYSDSLGTSSNTTTTVSSGTHSINDNNINGSRNIYSNYQQNYNRLFNDVDRNPHMTTIWSPIRPTIQINNEKSTLSTHHSHPELSTTIVRKTSPIEISQKKDKTPVQSPLTLTKQENNIQTNSISNKIEKQQASIDIQTSSNEKKDETSTNEKHDQQDWTIKIDKLHTMQAQREKEKAKSLRALPNTSKKTDNQPIINKSITTATANDNRVREASFQMRNGSYFDSLFDGNFFRKSSITNQQYTNSSPQRSSTMRNQPNSNSFHQPKTTIYPKHILTKKIPQYEPPNIINNSKKKQLSKQNQNDSVTPRENIHKDSDERFREALTKFRSDRAEQQQKESNESTAKRLSYGNYVRRSTKDDLLNNAIKPSPWSDFIDLKKGHLYSLTKEEKKDLYNQSKSYGERVRYRNFVLLHGVKPDHVEYRPRLWPILNQEPQSGDETTSHEEINENNDGDLKSSKRSSSSSTIKTTTRTFTKYPNNEKLIDNQKNHTSTFTDQSSTNRTSDYEDDDEDVSDFELSRKQKQKKRFHKHNSSVRTTSGTEESGNDETSEQQSIRMKNRDTDDDLFTVREEKTLESLEGARHKKR